MSLFLAALAAVLLAAAVLDHRRLLDIVRDVRARRRDRETRRALPALADALGSALGSGLALPVALAEIAPTLPPALAAATRRAAASLALGAQPRVAFTTYRGVVADEDIAPLAIVIASFARSGGRIAPSLARVAALLRGRLALEEERDALTAQARASAIVLVSLAPLGAGFFAVAMPDYTATLIGDGRALLLVALALETLGALWLWRIVRAATPAADLATLLDAVVVGLEAGLTFPQALTGIVERAPNVARRDDARHLLADLALGRPLADALRAFATDAAGARVAALVSSASRFGAPMASLLVVQADAIRTTQRHAAEAAARRLPVLMLFPLALCILPALLIVFLGPPLLSLLR